MKPSQKKYKNNLYVKITHKMYKSISKIKNHVLGREKNCYSLLRKIRRIQAERRQRTYSKTPPPLFEMSLMCDKLNLQGLLGGEVFASYCIRSSGRCLHFSKARIEELLSFNILIVCFGYLNITCLLGFEEQLIVNGKSLSCLEVMQGLAIRYHDGH